MNELTILNFKGNNVADSREVANIVNKQHKNLLADIRNYSNVLTGSKISPLDFFIESAYVDSKGETRPNYLLTKQGCEMIANKMTGEKGVLFTAKYVQAFNQMENYLINTGLINELRAELTSSIDSIVNERIQQIESKCSQYYRPSALTKVDLIKYIKARLNDENDYDLVKQRVLIKLNATKWEDIPVEVLINSLNIVDESIRIINLDSRSKYQTTIFD
jgi:Rha family phage regulatory protein